MFERGIAATVVRSCYGGPLHVCIPVGDRNECHLRQHGRYVHVMWDRPFLCPQSKSYVQMETGNKHVKGLREKYVHRDNSGISSQPRLQEPPNISWPYPPYSFGEPQQNFPWLVYWHQKRYTPKN